MQYGTAIYSQDVVCVGTAERASTAELLDRARAGEDSAWPELMNRYARVILVATRSVRLCEADAADVAQTCWLALYRKLSSIRDPEALGAWLYTTARRHSLAIVAARERECHPADWDSVLDRAWGPGTPPGPGGVEERVLADERLRALASAFAGLPERCQWVLAVHSGLCGLDSAAVARMLGLARGSIAKTRTRCVDVLWRRFARLQSEGENR
jgi:RNA polymerase sigma factor (sigma-70 family)